MDLNIKHLGIIIGGVFLFLLILVVKALNQSKTKDKIIKKAYKFYNKKKYNDALELFLKIYNEHGSIEILNKVSECYYELKDYETSLYYLNILKNNIDNLPDISQTEILKKIFYCNEKLKNLRNLQEILDEFEFNKTNLNIFLRFADILSEKRKFDDAKILYEKILKLSENNINALKGLANVYGKTNELNKASSIYQKLLKIEPNNSYIYYHLGKIYKYKQEYIKVIDILMRGISISKGELKYKIIVLLTNSAIESEEYELAIEYLLNGISEFKNVPEKDMELKYLLGICYYYSNNKDQAVKLWQKIYDINPHYENVKELLNKKKKNCNEIIEYLKSMGYQQTQIFFQKLADKFSVITKKFETKSKDELILFGKNKIVCVKLWQNPSSEIVLYDFNELLKNNDVKFGVLMLPSGLKEESKNFVKKEFSNIKLIDDDKFIKIMNRLI